MVNNSRDELKGKVMVLGDLVEYQIGTVASRMVISNSAGSVTVFSFDDGEEISEHTAPFDAMVTILEGECSVRLSGETYPMKAGDTIIFPANEPHAVSAVTRFKMMLVMIRG
ncbi:MAG: cupin domain-containing protein [Methanomicrobiaceae archaeon]|nr:cupin domain-containing protein [Methanomicrobiaceae archaeon]